MGETDSISRQAAIDALMAWEEDSFWDEECLKHRGEPYWVAPSDVIEQLPSVQPEPKWRPIKTRPMDEEERQEWSEKLGYDIEDEEAVIYSNLPDDGEEVLICYKWCHVCIDTFRQEEYGCYFEEGGDMDGVIAWMPLPEPYQEGADE